MKKPVLSIIKGVYIVLAVILMTVLAACGGGSVTPAPSTAAKTSSPTATATKKAASPVVKTTPTTAVKSATPSAVPKLNDISFMLTLDAGQEYTESTTPIFLRANQVLHLSWLVVKGGNHFHLTFTLPDGDTIAVRTDGTFAAYSSVNSTAEDLTKNGSLVFRPSDNDWSEGYYIFHSHITRGDASVSVKLLYWIEG